MTARLSLRDVPGYRPKRDRPACRWCGESLSRPALEWSDGALIRVGHTATKLPRSGRPVRVIGYGYRGGNRFCGVECVYSFANDVLDSTD